MNEKLTPVSRKPCIWMDAGVINYRLCDHNFECESCSLDRALQMPSENRTSAATDSGYYDPLRNLRQISFNPNAYYGHSFWYMDVPSPGIIRLGLNELAVKLLPMIKEVILPGRDAVAENNQTICWITTLHGAIALSAPIAGAILEVNTRFVQDLADRKKLQTGQVWLLTLRVRARERIFEQWFTGKKAVDFLTVQQEQVLQQFNQHLHALAAVLGPTLNDGGRIIDDLEIAVGPLRYFEIVKELIV